MIGTDRSLDFGKPFGFGLEAGSKPELAAVVGAERFLAEIQLEARAA